MTTALLARHLHHRRSGFIDELVVAARSVLPPAKRPSGDEVTTEDATGALRLVPDVRRDLDRAEVALIESVLDRGWTWEQLGVAYGDRSKQAMQQHYRRRGGKRTWPAGERPPRVTPEESPHRLTSGELDPADVAAVHAAIAALLSTAHDVAEEHTVDGAWVAFDPDGDLVEQFATIGLDALPRLEVACRTAAEAITGMVQAGWNRRDPGREARRLRSWTERLRDENRDLASWLDRVPDGLLLPRVDRPLVVGQRRRVHPDSVEIGPDDVDRVRASIAQALARMEQHQSTTDQIVEELRRRQAELGDA
ncbi:hypothetical protein GCM10023192_49160 [Amycolatopsis samaneae]